MQRWTIIFRGSRTRENAIVGSTDVRCLFCEIASDERPAFMVLDKGDVLAFLDHRPLFPGHVLLIPRIHCETLMDLPDEMNETLFAATKQVSVAVKSALDSDGIFVASNNGVSQSVPHLHIHVVPRLKGDGLRGFMWPRVKYRDDAHASGIAERIRAAL